MVKPIDRTQQLSDYTSTTGITAANPLHDSGCYTTQHHPKQKYEEGVIEVFPKQPRLVTRIREEEFCASKSH